MLNQNNFSSEGGKNRIKSQKLWEDNTFSIMETCIKMLGKNWKILRHKTIESCFDTEIDFVIVEEESFTLPHVPLVPLYFIQVGCYKDKTMTGNINFINANLHKRYPSAEFITFVGQDSVNYSEWKNMWSLFDRNYSTTILQKSHLISFTKHPRNYTKEGPNWLDILFPKQEQDSFYENIKEEVLTLFKNTKQ